MNENPGYGALKSMEDALEEKPPTTDISPQFIGNFVMLRTSAEVERTFSAVKNILTDWRLNFTDEHVKWHLVLIATW